MFHSEKTNNNAIEFVVPQLHVGGKYSTDIRVAPPAFEQVNVIGLRISADNVTVPLLVP